MKSKLILIIAIILGLITSLMVYTFLRDTKESFDTTDYVEVVVAKEDIHGNTVITNNVLELKKIPTAYNHPNALRNTKDVVGKITLIPITAGEMILNNQIIALGEDNQDLAYKVPEGKRALSIAVDEISGVSGLIKVGDRVDIITTIDVGEEPPITYSLLVLQDIEVLGVGKTIDRYAAETSEVKTVTLAVTIEDALPLKHATQRGSISLLLRSPIDDSRTIQQEFRTEDYLELKNNFR